MFEVIEIPYPEFVAVTYDVVFWTQYMKQSNQMIETLLLKGMAGKVVPFFDSLPVASAVKK